MLPLHLRIIVKQINETIDKAESRADDRSKRTNEAQKEVAIAVQSLADEFKAYEAKQGEAERRKNRRENLTIGSLIGTAAITLALAIIGGLQWLTLAKTDETN